MIVREGHRQLAEVGFQHFSAREVAKTIGYSIGTLYNVFGSHDALMLAINGHTLDLMHDALSEALLRAKSDRIEVMIKAYFDFASDHRHVWTALYDFRLPDGTPLPDDFAAKLTQITGLVIDEVARALPAKRRAEAASLAPSLLAIVHGHCFFMLNGTFALLGEAHPLQASIARIKQALGKRT